MGKLMPCMYSIWPRKFIKIDTNRLKIQQFGSILSDERNMYQVFFHKSNFQSFKKFMIPMEFSWFNEIFYEASLQVAHHSFFTLN